MNDIATPPILKDEINRSTQFTGNALRTFSSAGVAPNSVLAGVVGAVAGLGAMHAFGIFNPMYASYVLDACAFAGLGSLSVLTARVFGPAKRRQKEEVRRIDFNHEHQVLMAQVQSMNALKGTLSQAALDGFAESALLTFDSLRSGGVALENRNFQKDASVAIAHKPMGEGQI